MPCRGLAAFLRQRESVNAKAKPAAVPQAPVPHSSSPLQAAVMVNKPAEKQAEQECSWCLPCADSIKDERGSYSTVSVPLVALKPRANI